MNIRWSDGFRPNHVERLVAFGNAGHHTWMYAGQYYPAKKGTYWIVELFYTGFKTSVPTEQEARDLLWLLCNTMEKVDD